MSKVLDPSAPSGADTPSEPGTAYSRIRHSICERALKKAILHRKNALFCKLAGAHVGDVFMSLLHAAELNDIELFGYLAALLRHGKQVAEAPAEWMPWNYKGASAPPGPGADPP